MASSSRPPAFMTARVWSTRESRRSAVSVRAVRTRSAPMTGKPWPGQEELGVQLEHAAQGGRPLPGVALHLLGIAGVGRGPDEEVAAAQHPAVGLPGHGVVVGLALLVAQREAAAAHRELERVVVGPVRVAVLGRPVQVGEAELPPVDDGVVAGGEDVAVEAGRQRVVGDDLGGGPALRGGLLLPDRHAEDVVDVPVGVDGGVEAGRAPGADVVVDDLGQRARCRCRPGPGRPRWRTRRRWRRRGRSRRRR